MESSRFRPSAQCTSAALHGPVSEVAERTFARTSSIWRSNVKLAEARYDNAETGCCAKLDEAVWDARELHWDKKPFVKDHIRSVFHIPLNFGSVMKREHEAVAAAQAYPEDPLWLVDEVSPWGSDVFLATDRDVPNAQMEHFSGTFLTKVFEGPYHNIGRWIAEMNEHVRSRGRNTEKLYFYYAYCPGCAKHFKRNPVVLFAQVS
jgi:hypothetical protein